MLDKASVSVVTSNVSKRRLDVNKRFALSTVSHGLLSLGLAQNSVDQCGDSVVDVSALMPAAEIVGLNLM